MDAVIPALIGALGGVLGSLLVFHSTIRRLEVESVKIKAESNKLETESNEITQRITEKVLQMAEAELRQLKEDNDKLRSENADLLKMMRAMRMITIKLIKKIEEAGIDPELTEEEREALYDTGKLTNYARRKQ